MNPGTIIVFIILLAIVGAITIKIIKDKKSGSSCSCGCGCKDCAMKGECHK